MEWGPEPSVRWKPPLRVVCGAWERERGDSLSLTGKKKRIAHRVSVDQPSLCAVVQSAAAGWRKKIGGWCPFCVRYSSCRLLSKPVGRT